MPSTIHSDDLLLIADLASRLRYLGYYGTPLTETLTAALTEDNLDYYIHICDASRAAGYDFINDAFGWTRRDLPSPSTLTLLPRALQLWDGHEGPAVRTDSAFAFGRA